MEAADVKKSSHTHTIIFLHGCGSTAAEFEQELFESQISNGQYLQDVFPHLRWVFPDAGFLRSARFGDEVSQWYDLWSNENPHEREDEQIDNLNSSVFRIQKIIAGEATAVNGAQNIILGGISQGCATAIHALLKHEFKLGGFIGLSSWLSWRDSLEKASCNALDTPVFLSHSADDEVINIKHGEELRSALIQMGMCVEWHRYGDGGHWFQEPEGIDEIVAFLNHIMNRSNQ